MSTSISRIALRGVITVTCILLAHAPLRAQMEIRGRVIDPQGEPLPGIEVLLHAITETSGSDVDKDTSRTDGTFTVSAAQGDQNAVYFVAVMHEGQLYIGDLLRPPFQLEQEYVVRVGINPVDLSPEAVGNTRPPQDSGSGGMAGLVVIIVAVLTVAGIMVFLIRARPPARRRWLVELARLEEELAGRPDADRALLARRKELRERLLERKSE